MRKKKQIDAVGEYFQLYMESIWRILDCGGGALEILCYITLSRGAGANAETAWSITSIARYLQITRKKAEGICSWLTEIKVIWPAGTLGSNSNPLFPSQWQIAKNGETIVLPNSLIGGDQNIGPLGKLYHSVGKQSSMFEAASAKTLQLMMLLCFYENYDFEDYGGVSPQVWTRYWPKSAEVPPFSIPGDGYLSLIEQGKPIYKDHLISWLGRSSLLPAQNQEVYLGNAMRNLIDKELINETLYVWNADPLSGGTVRYTLCHLAHWMRDERPLYLIEDISRFCKEALATEDLSRFKHREQFYDILCRRFVMIGFEGFQARSSIVLKHEPQTLDQKISRNSIFGRTLEFREEIKNMKARALGQFVHDGSYY